MSLILLSVVIVILLLLLGIVTRRALIVTRERDAVYDFYEDTLEDVDSVVAMLERLMRRQAVSDDPDVQNLYRVMGVTHDILLGYRNAFEKREKSKGKKK